MLNYYNPLLSEWIYSDMFWALAITGHVLFLLVPGFVAMVVEPPRLFGFGRRRGRLDNVTPIRPRKDEGHDRPAHAA